MAEESAYYRAVARRAELVAEIEQIDIFLKLYHKFAPEGDLGTMRPIGDDERLDGREVNEMPSMSQEAFTEFAIEIMKEAGRPLTRSQLLKRFKEKGRSVGGLDEMKNLGTKVWRARDKIINIQGAGYWPKDIPCEAVDYRPDNSAIQEAAEAIRDAAMVVKEAATNALGGRAPHTAAVNELLTTSAVGGVFNNILTNPLSPRKIINPLAAKVTR